jgi:undecaprenyl-diphosphatase
MHYEFAILDFIQNHLRSAAGDIIMPLVTALGNGGILWIVLGVALLL